ncbi:hypothetical protein DEIPH_ctg029orf0042 [Deinococcus phoenicis]|uniref:Beta-lactamase class A catalytic domain-containing protein n=1 Tax=Deinococcus phoenicis TaxID=1476583 RepID=A0A016QPK9_9DEIO|nr:serine hydrolase [Deinococcus phoenicis]EYB68035.1 hypothetical protein DEIPH_ctg029orf0042 [Deinococcus phoenicis]
MRAHLPTALTLSLLATASAQSGEVRTQAQALTRLLGAEQPRAEWFAPEFLAQVPLQTIAAQLASIRQQYGAFQRLETFQGRPLAVYERGTLIVTVAPVDAQGRLTSFGAVPGPAPKGAPAPSQAEREAVLQSLTRVFQPEKVDPALFAPEFLAAVPAATLQASLGSFRTQFGPFVRIDLSGKLPQVIYERGRLDVTAFTVNAQGLVTGLRVVPAQNEAQREAVLQTLTHVFQPEKVDPALFAPEFLAAVPAANLDDLLASVRAEYGPFVRIDLSGKLPQVVYERGALNVTAFGVDSQGRITALVIAPPLPDVNFTSLEEARAAFAALPGQVSVLVRDVATGRNAVALNPTRLLAVGSAFKLAILAELQAQVTRGERAWTDEVTLTDAGKSLPSGTLQNAPAGSRYTLRDLAARMIRESDNTATDLLLRVVGRAGVEARLGQTAMPNTREFFALKNPANLNLLRAYRSAGLDRAARRAVLAQADTAPLPNAAVFAGGPVARDVEWFVSTERLCTLMKEVAALPETTQNPGVADPTDFARVSYKGGSEPGVLNLTTQVTNKVGRTFCVSATWNDARTLDEAQFIALYDGVLKLLR